MNNRLGVLLLCVLMVMTGYGFALPTLVFFIEKLALAKSVEPSLAIIHVGLMLGLFAFIQFLSAPFMGNLSDRIGRRPLMLISIAGYFILNLAFSFSTNLSFLYGARIIGGFITAGFLPVAAAYIADETSFVERGRAIAWLGSSISLGLVLGPFLGMIVKNINMNFLNSGFIKYDDNLIFLLAAILSLMALVLALFMLPEVLHKETRLSGPETQKPTMIYSRNFTNFHSSLPVLLVLSVLWSFCLSLFEGTFGLHGRKLMPFGPQGLSIVLVVCGLTMAIVQAGFLGKLILKYNEKNIIAVGLGLMGAGMVLLMSTLSLFVILAFVVLFSIGAAMVNPGLISWVSKTNTTRLGSALGLQTAAIGLGQAMGPILGGIILTFSLHLPYLFFGILLIIGAYLILK